MALRHDIKHATWHNVRHTTWHDIRHVQPKPCHMAPMLGLGHATWHIG